MSSASVHPAPRGLRGLDPARLLGVLGGSPRTSPPEIPGWRILRTPDLVGFRMGLRMIRI